MYVAKKKCRTNFSIRNTNNFWRVKLKVCQFLLKILCHSSILSSSMNARWTLNILSLSFNGVWLFLSARLFANTHTLTRTLFFCVFFLVLSVLIDAFVVIYIYLQSHVPCVCVLCMSIRVNTVYTRALTFSLYFNHPFDFVARAHEQLQIVFNSRWLRYWTVIPVKVWIYRKFIVMQC